LAQLREDYTEQAMTQAAVADPHCVLAELVHHGPDDAGSGQDDVRALRLQADDRATLRRVARAVQLDLAVTSRRTPTRLIKNARHRSSFSKRRS
jgi:hypothetical protein